MAVLRGQNYHGARIRLSVEPVHSSSQAGSGNGYNISVRSTDRGLDFESFYATVLDVTGPDELWLAARAFRASRGLQGASVSVDLWRSGRSRPASLQIWADWVQIDLSAHPGRKTLCATFFFRCEATPHLFHRVFVDTSFENAEAFGAALESEILRAHPSWSRSAGGCEQQGDEPDIP